jgi:hypothetical protein
LFNIKSQLEGNLEQAKNSGNNRDRIKLRELENQLRMLTNEFETSKKTINEKNILIEEKNKTIEYLSSQNDNKNNSYELFEGRFTEMESNILGRQILIFRKTFQHGKVITRRKRKKFKFVQ